MFITKVIIKGNYYYLSFDDQENLKIPGHIFFDFRLSLGVFVDEKVFYQLKNENNFFFAKESALFSLGKRAHSTKEIRDKLKQKKYDKITIDRVIDFLIDKKYLNDYEFAARFIEFQLGRKLESIKKIKFILIKKGIEKATLDELFAEVNSDDSDYESALAKGKKKLKNVVSKSDNKQIIKQKLFNHLAAKGFDFDIINKVVYELVK